MYIHVNPEDFTRKLGHYLLEIVKFDNKDKMLTLSRIVRYIYDYIEKHNIYDQDVFDRCKKIEGYCDDYLIHNNKNSWVKWTIDDFNVQAGIKMIEWCISWLEENNIKDIKVVNQCWKIRCFSMYWHKNFKCYGA